MVFEIILSFFCAYFLLGKIELNFTNFPGKFVRIPPVIYGMICHLIADDCRVLFVNFLQINLFNCFHSPCLKQVVSVLSNNFCLIFVVI